MPGQNKKASLKSKDLEFFKKLCNEIDPDLYVRYVTSDEELKREIEEESYFPRLKEKGDIPEEVFINFSELARRLGVDELRYYQKLTIFLSRYYLFTKYPVEGRNGLAYWMATGSGKTLIMKADIINYLEFLKERHSVIDQIEIVVTSSLAELVEQLRREIDVFFRDNRDFFDQFRTNLIVETIQALSNREDEFKSAIPENCYRLVLFDEAHVGLSGGGKGANTIGAFKGMRDLLSEDTERSFLCEYSATFTNMEKSLIDEYKEKIIFDYSYGKFFNDRYGKDFIFQKIGKDVVEDEEAQIEPNVKENLKTFNEKLEAFYYIRESTRYKFPDRPLLVVVGNTTVRQKNKTSKDKREEERELSDIMKFLKVLDSLSIEEKRRYSRIFNGGTGKLTVIDNRDKEDELLISFGRESVPFGIVNIGNKSKFIEKVKEEFGEDAFEGRALIPKEQYFENLDNPSSPINILVGSRKFSMGWNSFRVSQICLINFGTSKGNTVIQIFGRGVRLKGYLGDGKRLLIHYTREDKCAKDEYKDYSEVENAVRSNDTVRSIIRNKEIYDKVKLLETLAIYSLRKSYLKTFIDELPICEKVFEETIEVECNLDTFSDLGLVKKDCDGEYLPFMVVRTKESIEVNQDDHIILTFGDDEIRYRFKTDGKEGAIQNDKRVKVNLSITEDRALRLEDYRSVIEKVDTLRLEDVVIRLLHENKFILTENIIFDGNLPLKVARILDRFAVIHYDGDLDNPRKAEKLLVKSFATFLKELRKKILAKHKNTEHYLSLLRKDEVLDKFTVSVVFDSEMGEEEGRAVTKEIAELIKFFFEVSLCKPDVIDPYSKPKEAVEIEKGNDPVEVKEGFLEDYIKVKINEGRLSSLERIEVKPDKLNVYEMKFKSDLEKYAKEKGLKVKLYRILPNGEIFFPVGENRMEKFYPDFLLKYIDEENKTIHLAFVDPKGLVQYNKDKLYLSSEIKEIERSLSLNACLEEGDSDYR
ncbi:DEAD/DEAH box helicase family protein, partial [Hydrogenivirga sp. 128-5-R1-1]|uniref:DEAD/DEAH box helicase family protein n=1 Tax=Hydrogenivirga sp. 128-5-R1-1 TaxID=392423 RepID=UPI00015EF05A